VLFAQLFTAYWQYQAWQRTGAAMGQAHTRDTPGLR